MEKLLSDHDEATKHNEASENFYIDTSVKSYTANKTALFNLYAFTYEDSYQKL